MMASTPAPGKVDPHIQTAVLAFATAHYSESGAARFGIEPADLATLLQEALQPFANVAAGVGVPAFLASLRLEELVLARACMQGSEPAWELFLTRYRNTLYETAYKVAREESAARALADSIYAELYGVNDKGEQRSSKLAYYQGRGSLQGWLRTVVAQEYVNRYRRTRRETSLEAIVEEGRQFAAASPEVVTVDPRVELAVQTELAALPAEERFLLAAHYLDQRTLADIAQVLGVHESTVSRKVHKTTAAVSKGIRRKLIQAGMSPRQAEEAVQDLDVRDLRVSVRDALRQETPASAFYSKQDGEKG